MEDKIHKYHTVIRYIRTEKDLDSAFAHIVVSVENSRFLLQFVDDCAGVGVEQVDEALKHVQVESRRDQFAMRAPFLA